MLEMLLDGKNWFPVVTPLSAASIICGAFGVFVGLFIGILATGHVFAITTKMMLGILPSGINPWFALPFGFAMAIPGYGLAWLATRSLWRSDLRASTRV